MQELLREVSFPSKSLARHDVFKPIGAYRYFILVFTVTSALSSLALTYIYSEKYEAQKAIVFKPTEVTRFSEHDTQAFGSPTPAAAYKIISSTLSDLAKSDLLLRGVVTKLHLDVAQPRIYDGPFYYRWYRISKDWLADIAGDAWDILKYGRIVDKDRTHDAVDTLRGDIKIKSQDSQVFTLSVLDRYPDRAVAIADEIVNELTMLLREIQQNPATERRTELEGLLARKKAEVEEYQKKIIDLFNQNQVASISEEIEKGMYRYSQLLLEDNNLQAEIQQVKATIAAYSEQLSAENGGSEPSKERLKTDEFRKIATDKANSESKLSGLVAKQQSIDTTVAGLKDRLIKLPIIQAQYEVLNNQVQRSEHDYSMLSNAFQEARIRERDGLTELIIEDEPSKPKAPATPIKVYHVLLAFALGLLFSTGFAFVLDFFDVTLFSIRERTEQSPTLVEVLDTRHAAVSSEA